MPCETTRRSGGCVVLSLVTVIVAGLMPASALAREVRVAVAANFTGAAKEISALFEKRHGHRAVLSFGSTGQLYTQITQGAPYEVLLAADQARPERLESEGRAVAKTRFTYALGRLVLYSTNKTLVRGRETLRGAGFMRLAIANPDTAPYGAAAVAAMTALGVYEAVKPKIVQGNNIAQAYQFVAPGNAELGFVALSQVARSDAGSRWLVPASLHQPIAQDAVLLKVGVDNGAARDLLAFMKGPEARVVIEKFGYGIGD